MLRISIPYVVQICEKLERLSQLPAEEVPQWPTTLSFMAASYALKQLLTQSIYSPYLRSSKPHGLELLSILEQQLSGESKEKQTFNASDLWSVKSKYEEYRVALLSELESLDTFFVTQKGGFDTVTLLERGEALFSEDLRIKVPEAIFDAKEAAKCLAFEVSTAAGFHLFRVTECVLRRYRHVSHLFRVLDWIFYQQGESSWDTDTAKNSGVRRFALRRRADLPANRLHQI